MTDVPTPPTPPANPQASLQLDPAAPAAPSSPTPPVAVPVKPEGLPDRYFDPATGVRLTEVATTLAEIEAKNAADAEAFKDFPQDAAKAGDFYKLPEQLLPEGVKLPDGVEISADTDLLNKALPVLHQHKASKEVFHDLARVATAQRAEDFNKFVETGEPPAWITSALAMRHEKELAEANTKLGANHATRRQALEGTFAAAIGAENAKKFGFDQMMAGGIELYEIVAQRLSTQGNVIPLDQRRNDGAPPTSDKPLIDRLADSMYPQQKVS